jgi:hypothetical protein
MGIQAQQVLETAIANFNQTTGLHARVLGAIGRAGDAIVELRTDHQKLRFAANVKTVDRFETPAMMRAGPKNPPARPMLVAPYVTREIAERCRDLDLPFIDTAGNAYIQGPGLFIYVVGRRRPAELTQDRFRALNPAGLHITFALLCRPELVHANYREIAVAARVALGTVGPVMKDLAGRGLLRLKTATERGLLDPERMLQEWVTHYPTTLRPKLNPRRFQADMKPLQRAKIKQHNAYWGGEVAAEELTHILKPASFTIYARGPIAKLVAAGRMRADRTGNVEVLDTFWDFDAATADPGLVPPVLVYADLLATNDGRNAEAARLIYEQRIEPTFHHAA